MPPLAQLSRLVRPHTHTAHITELLVSQYLICFSLCHLATVGGNVIVNTVAGVPPSPFQANKRLASPVIPGTLSVSHVHYHCCSGFNQSPTHSQDFIMQMFWIGTL